MLSFLTQVFHLSLYSFALILFTGILSYLGHCPWHMSCICCMQSTMTYCVCQSSWTRIHKSWSLFPTWLYVKYIPITVFGMCLVYGRWHPQGSSSLQWGWPPFPLLPPWDASHLQPLSGGRKQPPKRSGIGLEKAQFWWCSNKYFIQTGVAPTYNSRTWSAGASVQY